VFLKNLIAYSGANLAAQFGSFLENLLVRRFLAPGLMGIWNYVGVMQNFVGTFDLGITQAASRDLPLLHGGGKSEDEQLTRSSACWGRLAQGMLFAAGIAIFVLVADRHREAVPRSPAIVAVILVVVMSWTEAMTVFCQSAQCYYALSWSMVVTAVITVALIPAATWFFGLHGIMEASVLVALLQALLLTWLAHRAGIHLTLDCRWPIVRRLIAFGLPLRLVDYPLSILMMADMLFVAHFCSVAQLAIYATGTLLFAIASDMPARMGNVLLSRIYVLTGGNTNRSRVASELRRYFIIQHALLMPFLLTTLWWGARFIFPAFLPKYVPALGVAQVLLLGAYFTPPNTLIRNFWIIDKRLMALLGSNLGGLAAGAAMLLVAGRIGHLQLTWIAGGMVCAYAIHFLILLCSVGHALWGLRVVIAVGLWALAGSVYVALLIRYILPLGGDPGHGLLFITSLIGWAKTQLWLLPLYIVGSWRGAALQLLRQYFPRGAVS
jgi:O-antigen/teichoic acid export membrane protein